MNWAGAGKSQVLPPAGFVSAVQGSLGGDLQLSSEEVKRCGGDGLLWSASGGMTGFGQSLAARETAQSARQKQGCP